jgi:hypothetical protein
MLGGLLLLLLLPAFFRKIAELSRQWLLIPSAVFLRRRYRAFVIAAADIIGE